MKFDNQIERNVYERAFWHVFDANGNGEAAHKHAMRAVKHYCPPDETNSHLDASKQWRNVMTLLRVERPEKDDRRAEELLMDYLRIRADVVVELFLRLLDVESVPTRPIDSEMRTKKLVEFVGRVFCRDGEFSMKNRVKCLGVETGVTYEQLEELLIRATRGDANS